MNEEIDNLMDRYFFGQLSKEESESLLKEISKNKDLDDAFKIRKSEHEVLEVLAEDNLRAKFNQWKVKESQDNKSKLVWLIPFGIAASIFLIFFIFNPFQASDSQLANEFYAVDYGFSKSESNDDPLLFARQILNTQNKKEFYNLETSLSKIDSNNLLYYRAQFYLGHLYYTKANYHLAQLAFKTSMADAELSAPSKWYLGLTLLQIGKTQEAQEIMSSISQSKNDEFSMRAYEILQKLK